MDLTKFVGDGDEVVDYAPGQTIFAAGDAGVDMLVVLEGDVEIRSGDTVLRTVVAGDVIGEMALIDNAPRSADAVSLTATRVAHIDERRFLFLVQETPSFALHVMSVLANRLRE